MSEGQQDMEQFRLFDQPEDRLRRMTSGQWPSHDRFPYTAGGRRVEEAVLGDLHAAHRPLIITGYAALDELIPFLAKAGPAADDIRLLLGSEPYPAQRAHVSASEWTYSEEMMEYWLERGISLRLSGTIVSVIDLLRSGKVRARFVEGVRLHAKMYCTEKAATLGSSNFSASGLRGQLEANARFVASDQRHQEAWQLAERYWERGEDFNEQLIALLEQLLRLVEWQEAIARAAAELLDGEWAQAYIEQQLMPMDAPLWPSQRQGIAQALWLLDTVGSVLVADATGSGKTRMGAHLIRATFDRIWSSGRARKGRPIMVCPPAVVDAWEREASLCNLPLKSYSHGTLSHAGSSRRDDATEALRRSQILAVDEAHNFLNLASNRTRLLLGNMADHTALFTATPLNRGVSDLLRLADMLGADNLSAQTLKMFETLLRSNKLDRSLTEDEFNALREEIQTFTVRRTKATLNRLVDQSPDSFLDGAGNRCRFPRHQPLTYALAESDEDRAIAREIRGLAAQLRGLSYLVKPIEMPQVLRGPGGMTEQQYLDARLKSAARLPAYLVMATLRSSWVALMEHLRGTQWAQQYVPAAKHVRKNATGDVLGRLKACAGQPPTNKLSIPLPSWLSDEKEHAKACEEEIGIYTEIGRLANKLSPGRQDAKADKLAALAKKHAHIVAFDSRPITLADMRSRLERRGVDSVVATGSERGGRDHVTQSFRPGAEAADREAMVALCSDSMSEGINLQSASCVFLLDMPSVIRIAEQRVGRIDRMDSPHKEIEAWWPEDAPEFALRTDERFIERYEQVEALLGSNLPLPEYIQGRSERDDARVKPLDMAREVEESLNDSGWDGIEDAFAPVRNLVLGSEAIIGEALYESTRGVSATVLSRVSLVRSEHPWAFFCIRGSSSGAPKWLLFDSPVATPVTSLATVCEGLRARLGPDAESGDLDEGAQQLLDTFLGRLHDAEKRLLPRKKQRALDELVLVVHVYQREASEAQQQEKADFYGRLIELVERPREDEVPDWNDLAERWLDLIRPAWYSELAQRKRNRPLLLKDLYKPLTSGSHRLTFEAISQAMKGLKLTSPIEERVAACIIGVRQ